MQRSGSILTSDRTLHAEITHWAALQLVPFSNPDKPASGFLGL